MLDLIDTVILLVMFVIGYIIYLVVSKRISPNNNAQPRYANPKEMLAVKKENRMQAERKPEDNKVINTQLLEMQFNNDYRDIITSFNDFLPEQRQIFNIHNVPTKMINATPEEVAGIVNDFIRNLNDNTKNNVSETIGVNSGWDELQSKEKENATGWKKYMTNLGLPSSLYGEPASKAPVKLLRIDSVEKNVSENETQLICSLIIQKMGVSDQMLVKVTFVYQNSDVNEDRDFFKANNSGPSDVIIEDIFVVGYLVKDDTRVSNKDYTRDNFYDFDELGKNDIMDQGALMKELIGKFKQRGEDMQNFADNSLRSNNQFDPDDVISNSKSIILSST